MKKIISIFLSLVLSAFFVFNALGATVYTVKKGDSLWKIAVKYETGLSEEIIVPETDGGIRAYEKEVIRLVNEIRAGKGLTELKENWELTRAARIKSQDMRQNRYFSHTSPTYGTPFQMMKSFGISYRAAGENIAYGQRTPQEVVNAWMNSSGHRANILNSSFTQIGVGYEPDGKYWTQMFIG